MQEKCNYIPHTLPKQILFRDKKKEIHKLEQTKCIYVYKGIFYCDWDCSTKRPIIYNIVCPYSSLQLITEG